MEVTATPLMNQVDTTNGYVVDQLTIQETPLGTGSFTQLAILSPGVHADFLGGAGSNAGLGNQAIFANGNRDTSNSFSLNGVDTNNLFNGNSTSQVGENRFVLNIGENFGAGGAIQTSTSVYGAIGQALPTPPVETIQEVAVNAAMYDATQGAHSGAHISVITKSGTNDIHGMAYEDFQNSAINAAPFFYNASPAITTKDPFLNRNQFGVNLGGPIKKNKLFYFVAYQGVRLADASDATKDVSVPIGLSDDRSLQGIVNAMQTSFGKTITTSQINPVAAAMLQAKLSNGQYLFPSAQITNSAQALALGYDAVVRRPECPVQRQSGHRQRGLQRERQGPADGEVLLSERSHHESFWSGRRTTRFSAATLGRKPGGRDQQHRDTGSVGYLAAARRFHPVARVFANRAAIHSRRLWHEPAGRHQFPAGRDRRRAGE